MRIEQSDCVVKVDTGAMTFTLSADCVLSEVSVGGKPVVSANSEPLIAASLFESCEYDGLLDAVPGSVLQGKWRTLEHRFILDGDNFAAEFCGQIQFGGGDFLQCWLIITACPGSKLLKIKTNLCPHGSFSHRFIRNVSLRLPLSLERRKRIRQAGDRGIRWNTRHWYQFSIGTVNELLAEPEHNIWRLFATDQNTTCDFHIWRAESQATSALTMQRGVRVPDWMAAHDRFKGLLFGYRGMAARAPKSLRVDAEGGGIAEICLWHDGLPALDINSPMASALFGSPHECGLSFFDGELEDALLSEFAEELGLEPVSEENAPFELPPSSAPAADSEAPPVAGGVALPMGALRDPSNIRLRRDGVDVPLQTRVTGFWPDGSIKWLLLVFPADGGAVVGADGEGEKLEFKLTRRDGSESRYQLDYGGNASSGAPLSRMKADQTADGAISIDTGPLQLSLRKGENWLAGASLNGRSMLSASGGRSFVDFLRVDGNYPCMTTHAQGVLDSGPFEADMIELEEAGPIRAVARLEGKTGSLEPARVIIRVEAYAGRSVVRVYQSVEFQHQDPRAAFVRGMGIELPVEPMPDAVAKFGGEAGAVSPSACSRAGLIQHSHQGYKIWSQQAVHRFTKIEDSRHRSSGWASLSGKGGGVAVALRDMWRGFPNELTVDLKKSSLKIGLWPESGPLMDVRRYSNYPHPSQGECTPHRFSNWVAEHFYGKDPFVGVSRTHELLLYFHDELASNELIESIAADFERPPLVYCGGDWYVKTKVVLPQSVPSSDKFPVMHANLEHFARFWIHHQKLWGWYGIWDYGDIIHMYKLGYGKITDPETLIALLEKASVSEPNTLNRKATGVEAGEAVRRDYVPDNEWAFDNGRWGWTNTEGLPGMFMQNQYLRTGDREIFFFAEAMARHYRDVDMRHSGRFFGLGTRHGVQHWSDGDKEERVTTHSEFRYIYSLTGDQRSRDFAEELFRDYKSKRDPGMHACHSGRLQSLLTFWEMTGSTDIATLLDKYAPCFCTEKGVCESPRVRFSDMTYHGCDEGHINAGSMFFWTFGGAHGLLEYYYLAAASEFRSKQAELIRAALLRTAEAAIKEPVCRTTLLPAVVFASLHASDPKPFKESLLRKVEAELAFTEIVPHNPNEYAGELGFLRGNVSGGLFLMNIQCYLLAALDSEPTIKRDDKRFVNGTPGPYKASELSWQDEFDRPELTEYFRIKFPQP